VSGSRVVLLVDVRGMFEVIPDIHDEEIDLESVVTKVREMRTDKGDKVMLGHIIELIRAVNKSKERGQMLSVEVRDRKSFLFLLAMTDFISMLGSPASITYPDLTRDSVHLLLILEALKRSAKILFDCTFAKEELTCFYDSETSEALSILNERITLNYQYIRNLLLAYSDYVEYVIQGVKV
jgi:hypothetical protein